jgi:16S rRNA (adenine1518-N6/adenine1519-N6)-dimethyltransferase
MLRARKRLGQHFLHDPAVIGKLVAAIAPERDAAMVEIGGGTGALTRPLVERLDRLHVVEIDTELARELPARVAHPERLVVHRADALKFDFAALAQAPGTLRVVGNLPYNISTPLLFHLLQSRAAIRDMHLMLQREVVERMAARPGGKDYGRLTVMLGLWATVERCFDIGPGAFTPAPQVWSSFVRVIPKATPDFPVADEAAFGALVARLFSMRRKTLGRSLKGWLDAAQIQAAGIDPRARPETLAPADFARLAALERVK